jgi:hypothetical protein
MPIYSADNEELFANLVMPTEYDEVGDPVIFVEGWLAAAENDKYFILQVSVSNHGLNENDAVSATITDYQVETLTGNWSQFAGYRKAFTIDRTAIGLRNWHQLSIRIRRLAAESGDDLTNEVVVANAYIRYTSNELGEEIS